MYTYYFGKYGYFAILTTWSIRVKTGIHTVSSTAKSSIYMYIHTRISHFKTALIKQQQFGNTFVTTQYTCIHVNGVPVPVMSCKYHLLPFDTTWRDITWI